MSVEFFTERGFPAALRHMGHYNRGYGDWATDTLNASNANKASLMDSTACCGQCKRSSTIRLAAPPAILPGSECWWRH